METYFNQVEDAVEFAEADNYPFTNTQIATKAFVQIFATRLYKDERRAWNKLPFHARTWLAFKTIFLTANREIREVTQNLYHHHYLLLTSQWSTQTSSFVRLSMQLKRYIQI